MYVNYEIALWNIPQLPHCTS